MELVEIGFETHKIIRTGSRLWFCTEGNSLHSIPGNQFINLFFGRRQIQLLHFTILTFFKKSVTFKCETTNNFNVMGKKLINFCSKQSSGNYCYGLAAI